MYVPNEYTVYLAPADREQFESYEDSLVLELQEYLAEHARRESYALLSSPRVVLETDDDLEIGEFGIATRMTQPKGSAEPEPEAGATMIYKPRTPVAQATEAVSAEELGMERELAVLTANGERHEITKRRSTIGRSKDCDVQIADPNISRRHAELTQEGATYWIADLDSTNGIEVNGKRVKRAKLEPGDTFTVGSTDVTFSTERE